jgi:hypothetical protein
MKKIWQVVHDNGEYPGISISQDVKDSWERSRRYGVNPYKPACDVFLSRTELEEKRAANHALIEQALVMMGHLHHFTEGSGFLFALGDRENYALELMGDKQSLEIGKGVGIVVEPIGRNRSWVLPILPWLWHCPNRCRFSVMKITAAACRLEPVLPVRSSIRNSQSLAS